MKIIDEIKHLAKEYKNEIVEIRRYIHRYPELSFNEVKTSRFICSKLEEYGIEFKTGYCKTGIIADIKGDNPDSRMVALRADIDALPIEEKNTFHYKSENNGVMHACGHDAHIASLLGTAKILFKIKNRFNGTVRLIFQPAEEKIPGGALQMLSDGIFSDREPDYVIAQHVDPVIEVGKIGVKEGLYMASTDELYITINGKGGHAALPNMITDTVLIASNVVVSLQQVVSRLAKPSIPTVLSFGKFIANGATNIIPNTVKIEGTFRTYDEQWRAEAHQKIRKLAVNICNSMGAECEVEVKKGYPFLVNDDKLTKKLNSSSEEYLGKENVEELEIRMTSEDFSYYSQKYPSVLYRLGVGNIIKGITAPLHADNFNIDEESLLIGSGLMAWNTVCLLNK